MKCLYINAEIIGTVYIDYETLLVTVEEEKNKNSQEYCLKDFIKKYKFQYLNDVFNSICEKILS